MIKQPKAEKKAFAWRGRMSSNPVTVNPMIVEQIFKQWNFYSFVMIDIRAEKVRRPPHPARGGHLEP